MRTLHVLALAASLACVAPAAVAQQAPPPYGPPITLEQAKKAVEAAEAEARRNQWNVVIAIVDPGGHLVLLARLDNTQFASINVAQSKAWTAVAFRRPSKAFQDLVAAGGEGLRILGLEGATPLEGGLPIVHDGKIIGAIGVSGVTSQQDAQIAQAGINGLQ
jgi:uncharacterized protein GlcG (DUF336 family)